MNPKINILELENDMFSVSPVYNLNSTISYIDNLNYLNSITTPASLTRGALNNGGIIHSNFNFNFNVNVCTKNINLTRLKFDIDKKYSEEQSTKYIKSVISDEITNKFIPIVLELGNKNREKLKNDLPNRLNKFDIFVDKIIKEFSQEKFNKEDKIMRRIYGNFLNASNYITNNGRYGPANFFISNHKNYNDTNKYIKDINNIKYEINNSIKDDIIIVGRKNSVENNGIHCFIYSDNDKNIIFNKIETPYNISYVIYYTIEEIGSYAENQYLTLHTKDITYYRKEKIKKINNSYE